MNNVITPHSKLLGVIEPVLNDMPAGTLRHALFRAFWDETASLLDIEDAFARVTARRQAVEPLRKFFASWSKTNNSAASVSGLANRLTLLARSEQGSAAADQLYRACGSLQRITDEDLGALGNTVHADLFYTMATTLCGDEVRERTAGGEKYLPRLHAEVRDDAGTLVARVQKTLYVRLKPRLRNAA